jgi:hypothetical protein
VISWPRREAFRPANGLSDMILVLARSKAGTEALNPIVKCYSPP